ncbi:RNase adapter RapZ [Simplicispira suum]|uniref:RNase adapter RapZ n=1 Tax=Simplicispira suum TaxID=2109915 RepID=A0A2S0MX72_9BURK|nr:RNase adapter RapZ [Simplicispira suum]AVO40496.1 RNase adapter RapZ [Simplicispira suum]MBW7832240.1 RNase adapter RapZ [Simplicispira suum]
MAVEIVLITGMSGSGKSVALRAYEDAGYYCVDNLPPELLLSFVALEHAHHGNRLAIAMDVRSRTSLPTVPDKLRELREQGCTVRSVFLDADTDTLVRRFSETRRRHPLTDGVLRESPLSLVQVIELERELLADLRESAQVIDTSTIRAAQLQGYVKSMMRAPQNSLSLVFQSFAFKRGVPLDADYVFDVRMLPNPHYESELRELTGKDKAVIDFLRAAPEAARMESDIAKFLTDWLDALVQNHRSYVNVAIGCTGGQHRSVYLVDRLTERFASRWPVVTRHRELDAR